MLRVKDFSLYLVFCDLQVSVDDTKLGMCSSEGSSPFVLTSNGDFGVCGFDWERKSVTELIDIVGSV